MAVIPECEQGSREGASSAEAEEAPAIIGSQQEDHALAVLTTQTTSEAGRPQEEMQTSAVVAVGLPNVIVEAALEKVNLTSVCRIEIPVWSSCNVRH